ncbi:Protein of unknown function [Gryllus bimaculatus]|nr:Protein of unknown function [Gryllus bimaculatus]
MFGFGLKFLGLGFQVVFRATKAAFGSSLLLADLYSSSTQFYHKIFNDLFENNILNFTIICLVLSPEPIEVHQQQLFKLGGISSLPTLFYYLTESNAFTLMFHHSLNFGCDNGVKHQVISLLHQVKLCGIISVGDLISQQTSNSVDLILLRGNIFVENIFTSYAIGLLFSNVCKFFITTYVYYIVAVKKNL